MNFWPLLPLCDFWPQTGHVTTSMGDIVTNLDKNRIDSAEIYWSSYELQNMRRTHFLKLIAQIIQFNHYHAYRIRLLYQTPQSMIMVEIGQDVSKLWWQKMTEETGRKQYNAAASGKVITQPQLIQTVLFTLCIDMHVLLFYFIYLFEQTLLNQRHTPPGFAFTKYKNIQ